MKYVSIVCLVSLASLVACNPPCVGCPKQLDDNELNKPAEILNKSLTKLAQGDGPRYTLVKVNSASTQVVSGTLDKINADLKEENGKVKTCDVEIWSQPWLENGITVTFDCPNEKKLVKKHSA